ncbi:MAG: TetR family transcriptional regulator C-terminal domain-containing protein [Antricoccus sp.]
MQDVAGVAGRIRAGLAEQNKSQQRLSNAIGLDPTKLSKSLSGVRRFDFFELKQIADYLDIPLDWLVTGNPAAPTSTATATTATSKRSIPTGRRRDTRARIIEAAWQLIAQRGLQAVRIADVADKCGVSTASVHYHFKTRQNLLEEALRESLQQSHDRLSADVKSINDPYERLLRLLELQLPNSAALVLEWSIWLQVCAQAPLNSRLREVHAAAYDSWSATIVEAIEYGRKRGVFEQDSNGRTALRLTALVDGLGIQFATGRADQPVERMREILLDFVRTELITTEHRDAVEDSPVTLRA